MAKAKRKGKGKGKGSAFERMISKQLSLWWTNGERDDVFWRTSNSGGRATVRGKRKTFGQYGDMQATDPLGQPLMDLCTIELKIGYKGTSMLDLVDKTGKQHPQYEKFLEQVTQDAKKADTPYWLLIARRHSKEIMVWMPITLKISLTRNYKVTKLPRPHIRIITKKHNSTKHWNIVGTTLSEFIRCYTPKQFRRAW